ncbi:MAG TPA: immunoglobulin-like domain-containing protein [Solirubrobacterales bacterium]|jgi:hypothetical protein
MSAVVVLAASIAAMFSHAVAPPMVADATPKEFCSSPGPRDYAAPLEALPPITRVPARSKEHPGLGNLPFGPRGIEMYEMGVDQVLTGASSYGFAFWDVGFVGNHPETPTVDWRVTAQIQALGPDGSVVEEVDHTHIKVGRIDDAYQPIISLDVPGRPGFYRFDIQITGADGAELGAYSEYLRVVPPSVEVRLGINTDRVRPGQVIAVRPEELGTERLDYGEYLVVQRRSDGGWHRYPPMNGGAWALWLGMLGPGAAGSCNHVAIPDDTPAGHYRFVKSVGTETGPRSGRSLSVAAPFMVASGRK